MNNGTFGRFKSFHSLMNKKDFIDRKIAYNLKQIGGIKLSTVDVLPDGIRLPTGPKELINFSGSIKQNIVYFLLNNEGKYYIEITNFKTKESEIIEHIKRGILFL
jgi:hypothetical protein